MKLIVILTAAVAAAALLAAPGFARATAPAPAPQHVVAVKLVQTVQKTRLAVWACQHTVGVPATRAGLNHAELSASGWRFLVWANHRWHARLTACRAEASHRSRIVAVLRQGLHGYPLEVWAARFEQAGRRWNVSPYLMAAISGTESTYGLYVTPGNAWGIGPGKWFADFGQGIDYLAQLLATQYDLTSTWTVGPRYCCSGWGSTTGSIMQSRFAASPYALRYPRLE